jgi:hypothetical protein
MAKKSNMDTENSRAIFRAVRNNTFGELGGKVEMGEEQITKTVEKYYRGL